MSIQDVIYYNVGSKLCGVCKNYILLALMIANKDQLKEVVREVLEEFFRDRNTISPEHELMDVKQVSALLNLARATVYEKTSLRLLPHYKKGKKILFKRSEILAWMESGRVDIAPDSRQKAIEYLQSRSSKR